MAVSEFHDGLIWLCSRIHMIDPVQALRTSFYLATIAAVSVNFVPVLRDSLVKYGARSSVEKHQDQSRKTTPKLLSILQSFTTVPHAWFTHFYIVSITSSLFWAYQFLNRGYVLQRIANIAIDNSKPRPAMQMDQIVLVWFMMLVQGIRRLLECCLLTKTSSSSMPLGGWLVGVSFYIGVGIAIWIEGSATLLDIESSQYESARLLIRQAHAYRLKSIIGLILFVTGSIVQFTCHRHLASLRKYSLPHHFLFKRLLCPHYFAECVIYFALALVSAPSCHLLNMTVLAALIFSIINLGITAQTTKEWYAIRFGPDSTKERYRMIPFLF